MRAFEIIKLNVLQSDINQFVLNPLVTFQICKFVQSNNFVFNFICGIFLF